MSVTVEKDNYSKIDKAKLLPLLAEAEGVDYLDLLSIPYLIRVFHIYWRKNIKKVRYACA